MRTIHHRIVAMAAVVAALLGLGGCGGGDGLGAALRSQASSDATADSAASEKLDDATITAKVRLSLARADDLSKIRIGVDTQNGAVTLSGPAPTIVARERASVVARSVTGVNSVNNQLTVKPS